MVSIDVLNRQDDGNFNRGGAGKVQFLCDVPAGECRHCTQLSQVDFGVVTERTGSFVWCGCSPRVLDRLGDLCARFG